MKLTSMNHPIAAATALLIVLACGFAAAQEKQPAAEKKTFLPVSCEDSEALLDWVANEARSGVAQGDVLIAIARPGSRETSAKLNRERLSAVQKFFAGRDIPAQAIVTAEGERINGLGQIEFYLGGRLFLRLQARHHQSICTECCNPVPEDFLPRRKRSWRRN